MDAQFEEKTYETQLMIELVQSGRRLFAPGQVLEGIVGFDMAVLTSDRHFWKQFPNLYPRWRRYFGIIPQGVRPRNEWWPRLDDEIEYFPKFKYNCFIQAKRPNRMVGSKAREYDHWNAPYFRYDTFLSQQLALESLAVGTSGNALVTYACPAFHKFDELTAAIGSHQIVKQSNFCEISNLVGHGRYSFVSPGHKGWAHSDPVRIESKPFDQALETLRNQGSQQSNSAFLSDTAEAIVGAAEKLGDLQSSFAYFAENTFQDANSQLARSLAKIYAFQFVCNVQLLIGYGG